MSEASAPQDENKDASHPDNKKLVAPPDFKGPGEKRRCTDVLCAILILAAWAAMTGIGLVVTGGIQSESLNVGNPARLINGIDYMGNICGVTEKKCGAGELYYTGSGDIKSDDDCKNLITSRTRYNIEKLPKAYPLPNGNLVCVKKCPSRDDYKKFVCQYDMRSELENSTSYETTGWDAVEKYACSPQFATEDYLNYCVPKKSVSEIEDDAQNAASLAGSSAIIDFTGVEDDKTIWEQFQGDMMTSAGVIFGFGIGVTAIVGFVYLRLLRVHGVLFTIVWGLIAAIFLCIFLPGMLLIFVTAPAWRRQGVHDESTVKAIEYLGYVFLAIAGLYVCLICCMRRRIMLALGITKEAARAVAYMPILTGFPLLQVLGVAVFFIPWIFYSLYLASSGDVKVVTEDVNGQQVSYREFEYTSNMRYAGLYMLFIWFWTTQFVVACGQLIIAMAIATWYFNRNKTEIGNSTAIACIRRGLYYHMGTAAFGSLIIAIIKTIRAILAYLQNKARKSKSKVAQAVLGCLQCCMWCIEKCMRFLNKNAYIQTAIFGYDFCKAARQAFFLILRNVARIMAVGMVSEIVTWLGKLLVPSVTVFLAYLALQSIDYDLYSFWTPLVFTFLISWMITDMFIQVFAMAISTLLQCYIADEEMFADNMFAEGSLQKTIKSTNDSVKALKSQSGGQVSPANSASGNTEGNVEMAVKEEKLV